MSKPARSQVVVQRKAAVTEAAPAPEATTERMPLPKTIKAFTTFKAPGGHVFVEITLDSQLNVIDFKPSLPDMRPIIQERFKVAVGKHWLTQG